MVLHKKMKRVTFFFPLMAISFLRLSKVSRKKFLSFSLELGFFSLQGDVRVFLGTRSHFLSTSLWLPRFLFVCVCLTYECVSFCIYV